MTQDELAELVRGLLRLLHEPAGLGLAVAPPTEGPWARAIRHPIQGLGTFVGVEPPWGTVILAAGMDTDEATSVALHELAHLAVWRAAPAAEQERVAALAYLWLREQTFETLFLPSAVTAPPERPVPGHDRTWWRAVGHLLWRAERAGILAPWPAALRGLGTPWLGATRLMHTLEMEAYTLHRLPIREVLAKPMPRRIGRLFDVLGVPE